MAKIEKNATWNVREGDLAALRLTAEVFLARQGVDVMVRDSGTIIGQQGSILATGLGLLLLAPARALPKRIRIDIDNSTGAVSVQARLESASGLTASMLSRRYERFFDRWLEELGAQMLPSGDHSSEEGEDEISHHNSGMAPVGASSGPQTREAASYAESAEEMAGEPDESSARGVGETRMMGEVVEALETGAQPTQEAFQTHSGPKVDSNAGEKRAAPRPRRIAWTRFFGGLLRRRGARRSVPDTLATTRQKAALGDSALASGLLARAQHHYDEAIEAIGGDIEPDSADAAVVARVYRSRGEVYARQSKAHLPASSGLPSDYHISIDLVRRAIADYDESLRLDPKAADVYHDRALAYIHASRCERDLKIFRKASDSLQQAVADLARELDLEPERETAYSVRALAQTLLHREAEAEADINHALSLGADAAVLQASIREAKQAVRGDASAGEAM